ncbi:DENN domain-containing protein 2A isoform X2 [Protopterus annectens]|uniref:DENN domain-containing protein 2A isoform X2 n=1 Tax=Protopterus annectens TaxID=7888 RepID=UPI001CFA1229|nr:DENN domain-containing protein 2A isoform X2 [Protopterus annectens]
MLEHVLNLSKVLYSTTERVTSTRKSTKNPVKTPPELLGDSAFEKFCITYTQGIKRRQPILQEKGIFLSSPLQSVDNWLVLLGLRAFAQNMLNQKLTIGEPVMDLTVKDHGINVKKQLKNPTLPVSKSNFKNKNISIKEKISEWEGKRETLSPVLKRKESNLMKKEESLCPFIAEKKKGDFEGDKIENKKLATRELLNKAGKENERKEDTGWPKINGIEKKQEGTDRGERISLSTERNKVLNDEKKTEPQKENTSVLNHVKKFEQVLKESPVQSQPQLPGNYYSPQCLQEAADTEKRNITQTDSISSELKRKHLNIDSEAIEPIFGTLENVKLSWTNHKIRNIGNVYTEPGVPQKKPSINPLPKPRRTFRHEGEEITSPLIGTQTCKRDLPPLPSIPPPPLPSCPPPRVSRRLWNEKHRANVIHRKSYEFEDLLQSSSENGKVDWYAQSKLSITRTLSEENIYEDILDPPSKENPYEDIEPDGRCLGNKCVPSFPGSPVLSAPETPTKLLSKPGFFRQTSDRRSFKLLDLRKINRDGSGSPSKISPPSTPSSPDDTCFLTGDPQNPRRRRKIPKVVLKINAIFEARRGKKRVKRFSQSTETSSGKVTDENSESESDNEEKLKAHSQRLVFVKSILKQAPRYRTLERDLIELQERQLFEYFVVVSLHKKQSGSVYLPEVTQQFPLKFDRSFKFMREAEDQLKAIPQFCFPDAKDWVPVTVFASETFSFVLTGEDGSRRFGYCRRLLPNGKGKRLPEVYCIVSRLGCFNLFSKILDEVEKRRVISPALVQPFMRGIMEAPFPAPGRKISVKNFLPGSGTEVIELCRPLDSRLEHVDFECLFSSLSVRHLMKVFASLLVERRVIFTADKLSTLSKCCHAVVALLYPFTWQHTYIPVLPPSMIDIVCSPTPFFIGLLSSSLTRLRELPVEEVLVVDLCNNKFLRQMEDEDFILPRKLQAALEHILDQRNEMANEKEEDTPNGTCSLNMVVSEAFVRFFVEIVGHYSLFIVPNEKEERIFQREAFRKSVSSRSLRRFLEVFMETQMFGGFIQDREFRKQGVKSLFELRAQDYLDTLPGSEQSGVNRFLKGLGNKMKFLHKK